jgi:hypothetical protein
MEYFSLKTQTPIHYHTFLEPLKEEQLLTSFLDEPRPDEDILKDHRKIYAEYVPPYDFHQVLLGFPGTVEKIDPTNLEMVATSSYHVLAVRKNQVEDFTPAVIEGLIETIDHKFVYGVRGGQVKAGEACIAPAGHCDSRHRGQKAIFDAFYEELREELGLLPRDISSPVVLGYMTDPDFTCGINFVFHAKTDLSFGEIRKKHQDALAVYLKEKDRGATEKQAREAIAEARYPNTDAWEHSHKIGVVNDIRIIDQIINTRTLESEGKKFPLLDIGRMSLVIYREQFLK